MQNNEEEEPPLHIESVPEIPAPNHPSPSPPLDLDLLSFDQRGAVIQQLWLNCSTTQQTITLCKRVAEDPAHVAILGLADSIQSIRDLINTSVSTATRNWIHSRNSHLDKLVRTDSYERDRYEKEYASEEGGPDLSPSLLPLIPLILFLSTSHPLLVSLPASKAAFDLLLELVEQAFPSENSLRAEELSSRLDEALMKVVRTRWRLLKEEGIAPASKNWSWDVEGDLRRVTGPEFERARRKGCKLELVSGFLDDLVEEGRGGGGERERERVLGERVREGAR